MMSAVSPTFLGKTAIAGVGYTEFSKDSGRSVHSLAVEACRAALDSCGLEASDIDGIVSYSMFHDSVSVQAVQTGLAIPELTYASDLNWGGSAPCMTVINAAMAIHSGMARNVLVYRALNGRSGIRLGATSFPSPTSQYRYPMGWSAYAQYIAMWARRYMIETGATEQDLGAVVCQQREYSARNPRAISRTRLTMDEYLDRPLLVDPFRAVDCTSEVDGACAMVVAALDRARTLAAPPVVIKGAAWSTGPGSGLDIADFHTWPDLSRNAHSYIAPRLWEHARLGPEDVDFAEIYDCFSIVPLLGLEAYGFVPRGEAGSFVRSGETGPNGRLPTNTHGGLLCEGYVHGMNTVCEAVLQVQQRCGERQLERASTCVVTSGALVDGSALILQADG
jgi:acetyl-CoA acetyltransferase